MRWIHSDMSVVLFYCGKQQFLLSSLYLCGIVYDISSCRTLVGYILRVLFILYQNNLFDPSCHPKNSATKNDDWKESERRMLLMWWNGSSKGCSHFKSNFYTFFDSKPDCKLFLGTQSITNDFHIIKWIY